MTTPVSRKRFHNAAFFSGLLGLLATALAEAATAALREAELGLEFTKVVSPIDGRVSRAMVTRGNLVSGGQGDATLLTTVVSVDPIYASFDADEQTFLRYGARVRRG